MQNITREKIENDYKEAIRNKYNSQKDDDKYSQYLENPSQALLRDLCWEIFRSDPKTDDINVYRQFFKFDFNPNEENTSVQYTDKFRKIGDLFREGKKATKTSTLDLAAILVDLECRPFRKFQANNSVEEKALIEDLKKFEPSPVKETGDLKGEREEESFDVIEDSNITENSKEDGAQDEIQNDTEDVIDIETQNKTQDGIQNSVETLIPIGFVGNVKKGLFEILFSKYRRTVIATAIIFSLIATAALVTVIYVEFLKKGCMQWSGDHYDEVSCDLEVQGIGTFNAPKPYDQRIIDLRRIKVCDTTTFFKNEEAVVWYAKVGDEVEFFNTHGMHPENGRALRPVTPYIIGKYVKKH